MCVEVSQSESRELTERVRGSHSNNYLNNYIHIYSCGGMWRVIGIILLTLFGNGSVVMCRRDLRLVEHDDDDTRITKQLHYYINKTYNDDDDSFVWEWCGESVKKNGSSVFRVSTVTLEPERIHRGTTAVFRITAAVDGRMEGLDKGVVDMVVHLGGVQVFSEEDVLCDVSSCPVPQGGAEFDITYTREFPLYTPPGRYHMTMQGRVPRGEGKQELFCVDVAFTVHFFSHGAAMKQTN